jgi:hypothetical protein
VIGKGVGFERPHAGRGAGFGRPYAGKGRFRAIRPGMRPFLRSLMWARGAHRDRCAGSIASAWAMGQVAPSLAFVAQLWPNAKAAVDVRRGFSTAQEALRLRERHRRFDEQVPRPPAPNAGHHHAEALEKDATLSRARRSASTAESVSSSSVPRVPRSSDCVRSSA